MPCSASPVRLFDSVGGDMNTRRTWVAGLILAMATPALAAAADSGVTLPAGTTLQVKLMTTLTSKTSKTGDKFTGIIEHPINVNGKDLVPDGSFVEGHVSF